MQIKNTELAQRRILWGSFLFITVLYTSVVTILIKTSTFAAQQSRVLDFTSPIEVGFTLTGLLCLGIAYALPRSKIHIAVSKMTIYLIRIIFCALAVLVGLTIASIAKDITRMYLLFSLGFFTMLSLFPIGEKTGQRSDESLGLS